MASQQTLVEAIRSLPSDANSIAQFLFEAGIRGEPVNPFACPIANYLSRKTRARVVVTSTRILANQNGSPSLTHSDWSSPTPAAVSQFVRLFDNHRLGIFQTLLEQQPPSSRPA